MKVPSGQLKKNQIIPKYIAEFNLEENAAIIISK